MHIERFAPSPTGLLHLGHGYSALTAFDAAQQAGGRFLLRIEDIDPPRCKPEFEQAIYDDLRWLGLAWETPVMRQSKRMTAYQAALQRLTDMGLTYPCACTRKDIKAALSAPQEGAEPHFGPDGVVYPGTCRHRQTAGPKDAIRLNMKRSIDQIGNVSYLFYAELGKEKVYLDTNFLLNACGDIVLARKGIGTSYHLAVVVDDAAQKITHVTRGVDMAPATQIHRLLQALLNLPTPVYRHHRLIRDENGKRLAKRFDAMALRSYRSAGKTPDDIRGMLGLEQIAKVSENADLSQ